MGLKIFTYNLNDVDQFQHVKKIVSELKDIYKREIINFVLNEIEKLNIDLVQIVLEIDGDFDFTFKVKEDYLLWFSVQSPALTMIFYQYEYYWATKLSYIELEENIYSFLRNVFSGNYWIEEVVENKGKKISSSLHFGKLMKYISLLREEEPMKRIIEGTNLYRDEL